MAEHSTPTVDNLKFVDISREDHRVYSTPDGEYRIDNPVALAVKPSGSHRVLAYDDGQYVSHYIPADGKRPIRWIVEPGERFFIGWGETAEENIGVAVQPEI